MKELNKIVDKHILWLRTNYTKGECANLSEANLSEADLSGANLSKSDLRGANLSGANLSKANLNGAYLSKADLSEANLSKANLSKADLRGADLRGANLRGADLGGANLSGADLNGAYLSFIKGKNILIFNSSQHTAYAFDGIVQIGCRKLTISEWLEQGEHIGENSGYKKEEIETYLNWIRNLL